jgi:hypothetical protein
LRLSNISDCVGKRPPILLDHRIIVELLLKLGAMPIDSEHIQAGETENQAAIAKIKSERLAIWAQEI